jgi:DNA-binding MurR/RpiR family transcriptional regulator
MPDLDTVTRRLEEAYPTLSPQLKLAARYVLDAPNDVALQSMRGLAARAGVHPSTMSRLAREVRFDDYQSFKEPFRDSLKGRPSSYAARARQLQWRDEDRGGDALFGEFGQAAVDNVRRTLASTSPQQLETVAALFGTARQVYVVGMRKCFPVAYYFHYACRMFGMPTLLVEGRSGTAPDELRGIGPDDVMLVVGFDPYTWDTVQSARRAVDAGAAVVAVTDSKVSPLATGAAHVFVVANASPSFFRSVAAALTLVEAFVAYTVADKGAAAIETLDRTEQHLRQFGAYWGQDGERRAAGRDQ